MRRPRSRHHFKGMAAMLLSLPLALSAATLSSNRGSLEAGAPPAARHPLSETLSVGGRLEAEYRQESDYDLDRQRADTVELLTLFHPSLALSWRPAPQWSVYGNLEYVDTGIFADEAGRESHPAELRLDKLFIDHRRDGLLLRLGRQRLKDRREWMLDDTLDGLRLSWRHPDFTLTAAWLRERAFTEDLLNGDDVKAVDHLWLHLNAPRSKTRDQAVYLMVQNDQEKDEQAVWFALHNQGEWEDIDYWAEAAAVGVDKRGRRGGGFGFDIGASYRLMKRPRIYVYGGYAFGSGDPDDVDLGFRQTDLQDNAAKFGGVTRIAYYGELLDPELSNLTIATLGIGIRPVRNASIDLLWHGYLQHYALDELRESDLVVEPDGRNHDIGQAVDLVVGYRIRGRLRAEAIFARFYPGSAFADQDPASLLKLQLRYNL